ncbi:MAG: NADH-quinone oxidoreductase subunit L [FCB group bacterium]|nr:NADH-quinone oxidoreductase subunit L [FCB group bacterium]
MNIFIQYALVIYFLPLIAFAIQIFVGKRLPRQGDWVSIGAILTTLVLALAMFASMLLNYNPDFKTQAAFTWIDQGAFQIRMGFLIDNITIVMLLVVALISSMSHIYSLKYMAGDPRYSRYYAFLSLFTFSMNGIILADNLVFLYMSWELVGLSSYLLIGFWFEKDSAANAGKKAFLTNRVGDIGFFIGILIFFTAIGSFSYGDIFAGVAAGKLTGTLLTLGGIGLFMGAVGKSAQFPLHIWLPDAMEGPTPVSALIHAATMVAAGVYMMVRLFGLMTPDTLLVVAYIGGFTAFFAATIAITRNDIKQVLAYSTVSQLGYMILSVGTGAYVAAFFHLLTHAMFKANLFYGAGSVIHSMHHALHKKQDHETDPQDMRNMGGFKSKMPITYWSMMASTLAISGVPFFSGFLSKDAILAGTLSFAGKYPQHFLLPVFGFGAALITAFYMFRLMYMTFHNQPRRPDIYNEIQESPREMTFPLILLATLCLFIFYTLPNVNPLSDKGWFSTLIVARDSVVPVEMGPVIASEIEEGMHHSHYPAMGISIVVVALGILLAWLMYLKGKLSPAAWAEKLKPFYRLSAGKYFVDELYAKYLYRPVLGLADRIGYLDWDLYDKYFINGFGRVTTWLSNLSGKLDYDGLDQGIIDGIGRVIRYLGAVLRGLQTGRLQSYLLFALLGIIIILVFQTI